MENLKTQIESVRDYAYRRLENGDFDVIDCYYDENVERVRVIVEIDSYRLDLVVFVAKKYMYQTSSFIDREVILFNYTINIPTRIRELVEKKLEEYNSMKKELEIKRLEEKLNKLKNQ